MSNTQELTFDLVLETKQAVGEIKAMLQKSNAEAGKAGQNSGASFGKMFLAGVASILTSAAVMSVFNTLSASIKEYSSDVLKSAMETEKQAIAFTTLTGSAEKSADIFDQINKLAVKTPFNVEDLRQITKSMLSYGISLEDVIPTTKMLGDITAGTGGDLMLLAKAYGQVKTKGKLYAQELNQLGEQGLAVREIIANKLGVSISELVRQMETGDITVSFEDFAKIIKDIHKGKFLDLMAKQADTAQGRVQNLGEQLNLMGQEIIGIDTVTGKIKLGGLFDQFTKALAKVLVFLDKNKQSILDFGTKVSRVIIDSVKSFKGLYDLIFKGDFTRSVFGLEEDSELVNTILTARDTALGLYDLLFNGNYSKEVFGQGEDSGIVDILLTAREIAKQLRDDIKSTIKIAATGQSKTNTIFGMSAEQMKIFNGVIIDTRTTILDIKQAFEDLWNFLAPNLLPALTELGNIFVTLVQPAFNNLTTQLGNLWNTLSPFLPTFEQLKIIFIVIAGVIGTVLIGAFLFLTGALKVVMDTLSMLIFAFNTTFNFVRSLLDGFLRFYLGMMAGLTEAMIGFGLFLSGRWQDGWNRFWGGIGGVVKSAINGIIDTINAGLGAINDFGNGLESFSGGKINIPDVGKIPRFATGGEFMVGGKGGVDKNLVQFMATRGEKVIVQTPSQQNDNRQINSGNTTQYIYQDQYKQPSFLNLAYNY